MDKNQQIQISKSESKLERFVLGFEYNKTLQQVKHDVRVRTSE